MKNLLHRVLTAIILLPAVCLALFSGGNFLLALLALVSFICSIEIADVVLPKAPHARPLAAMLCAGLFLPVILFSNTMQSVAFICVTIFAFNCYILFAKDLEKAHFEKLTTLFFLSFYVSISLACVFWLQDGQQVLSRKTGLIFILVACVATWCNDSFAYFGGNLFGKNPLFKSVSRNKTWEGFLSGAFFTMLFAILTAYLTSHISLRDILFIALPCIILAPVGDLIESRFKRLYNVKDFSNILPGHGGLFDRIDSLLVVLPWTALYAFIIRPL